MRGECVDAFSVPQLALGKTPSFLLMAGMTLLLKNISRSWEVA